MGKKKGKKSGEPEKKEEKAAPPQEAEVQGAAGGAGDAPSRKQEKKKQKEQQKQPEELQGAVGGSVEGQQKKKSEPQQQQKKKSQQQEQTPPEQPIAELPGPPQQQQKKKKGQQQEQTPPPEQPIAELPVPPQQQQQKQKKKKGQQQEQTPPPEQPVAEPPRPPQEHQQQKKKKGQQQEQTPPPEQPIAELPVPQQQQRQRSQQRHEETPPPVQPQTPSEPPPGYGRGGRGRGRGQQQVVQPETRPGQPYVEQAPPQQPPPQAWRRREDTPPQQMVGPLPGMQGPQAPIGAVPQQPMPPQYAAVPQQAMPPQYAAVPQQPMPPQYAGVPQQAMPPQYAAVPQQAMPPRHAVPAQARAGPPPGMRGPSPPQQSRPAPGTLVPVMRQSPEHGVAAITKGIQTLSIPVRKHRDRCGTKGRPIIVETNHLALDFSRLKNNIVIHYDVTIDPNLPKRLLRPAMETFRRRHYPQRFPAFDGRKNMYSSGQLPFGGEISDEVEVLDEESNRNKTFKITVKFASQVDLNTLRQYMQSGTSLKAPQEAIQAIDIVMRTAPAFRFVPVGRSFFTPPRDQVVDLGDGLELWYGFYQSAILGWKPFLNIDVAHKGFPSPRPVPEVICEILKLGEKDLYRELSVWQRGDFLKYIKGLKIDYMIPGNPASKRTYKVNNVVESAIKQRFQLDNGTNITVGEYFEREKRVRLRYPHLPCLHVGSINRPKPIYVPSELCSVTKGQVTNRKMNEIQTSNMIKQAATNTDHRKKKIYDALRSVGFNEDDCVMREFGLSVSDKFEKVEARILNAPSLEYRASGDRKNVIAPAKGVWRPSTFLSSNSLTNWVILSLNKFTRDEDLRRFDGEMQKMGGSLGMNVRPVSRITSMQGTRDLEDFFRQMKSEKVQLVVIVIPDRGDVYSKVKREAEVNVGVLTQCIKARTIQRMNPATCSNILLKVNSKLNGINHTLASVSKPRCLLRPIMIVGADVTHPSPDQTDIPSVAAVCASHDPKAFQYNIQVRLQPPRVEIIEDLEAIMRTQLMFFYKRTSYKPERIIFFRDGVSEGQFAEVLNKELNAIRRACTSLHSDYKPKVTFLVVQKRHHTRFFPTRDQDADGKNRNVPAGTVVDREITHPTEVDFYLVSHASIQGVSRPTKYRLLWNDDEEMSEDELEEITYYLCHMFSRCTRSVSYPAPTYNAHLAAYRARVHIEGEKIKLSDLQNEQKKCAVVQDIIAGHPMFFV